MNPKRVLEVLRRIEWSSFDSEEGRHFCVACDTYQQQRKAHHDPTCELAKLIAECEKELAESKP